MAVPPATIIPPTAISNAAAAWCTDHTATAAIIDLNDRANAINGNSRYCWSNGHTRFSRSGHCEKRERRRK
jgi:hypothetical protein